MVTAIAMADGGKIVLEERVAGVYRQQNLRAFHPDGSERWTAQLPENTGSDAFVDVRLDGGSVIANTWSCWALWLDPSSGRTLNIAFTK